MLKLVKRFGVVAVLFVALLGTAPARAALYGGIEIGAKGVKATAVQITPGDDGNDVKVLLAATQNTTLTAGLMASKKFAPQALKETGTAIAAFAERMQKEYKVPSDNIYVVGSSGLFSALAGDKDAIANNRKALAAAVRTASGRNMDFIDVRREAELSIAGVVPRSGAGDAVLLDIGSGNTKGGYRNEDGKYVTFGVPYGSVTFADLIAKRAAGNSAAQVTFAEAAVAARQTVLMPALRKSVDGKTGLTGRDRIYLGGGAVWAAATFIRPGDRGSYVALTSDDVDAYCRLLLKTPGKHPSLDLSGIENAKVRAAAQKEIDRVKKVFTPDQLLAGAEILKALADEFAFGKDKKVRFSRHAYLGWILAYVVEKGGSR